MKMSVKLVFLAAICTAGLSWSAYAKKPASASKPAAAADGKKIYDRWCAACHEPTIRAPGTVALTAKYGKDQPGALRMRKDLTPDEIAYFVRHGVLTMPYFRKTEISDAELAALGKYLSGGAAARTAR